MHHLVTGGSGYVGDSIIRQLVKRGESVISLDVIESQNKLEGVEYITGSILDNELLDRIIQRVDYVHHNAALVPLTKSGKLFEEVNVKGTKNVLECSIKHEIKHLCHMSSSAVFGIPKELPLLNLSLRQPVEIYGHSKKNAEDLVISCMAENPSFSASIVRPRTILGTRRLGIFELLFKWISKGIDVFLIGKGDGLFQFAHIDDIVNASINSCLLSKKGIYNVGVLEFNTLSEDLKQLTNYAKTGSKVRHLPEKLSINGLRILDKMNLSPFAPWHYLTYHKPFFFESKYVYEKLEYSPKGSNIECLIESYNSYLKQQKFIVESKDDIYSPHKSKLKANLIDITAKIISKLP